jgi:geranylgeranyl diphosphate synthase, type II
MSRPDELKAPDQLKTMIEQYLEGLAFWPDLHEQADSMRYALVEMGGKRIRPVISLATGEAAGASPEQILPAAAAVELVHNFSLVHDDLPALDGDDERRGKASVWAAYGDGTAVLAGDGLLAEAFRLAASYPTPDVARELAENTLGMIGGQYLDTMVPDADLATVHRLKTGRLFYAAVTVALWAAGVPEGEQSPWRGFAEELGLLFQAVDDILDGDGYVASDGVEAARRIADEAGDRAQERLRAIPADTAVLEEIVAGLAVRTA